MTKLEFDICLKVLEQYYIRMGLKNIFEPIYNEKEKAAIIDYYFPLNFDDQLDKKYNIRKESFQIGLINRYILKDAVSFIYFYQTFRNYLVNLIGMPSMDALDDMLDSFKTHLFRKAALSITNHSWMSHIEKNSNMYAETIKQNPNDIVSLLDKFDKCVNPFLDKEIDEKSISNIFDVDVYMENGISNCAHFTIKNDNIVKKYNRHSSGFLYPQKIFADSYNFYIGHYFNIDKNGEVVSIILEEENKVYNIKYNLTDKTIDILENVQLMNDDSLAILISLVNSSINNDCQTKELMLEKIKTLN